MTTKFLDDSYLHFQDFIVMAFPTKNTVSGRFSLSAPTAPSKSKIYFCRPDVSEKSLSRGNLNGCNIRGLGPKGANQAKMAPFRTISALPLRERGAEELNSKALIHPK